MTFTTQEELLIEQKVANEQKSTGVAYALWFFLGIVSLHRFYLGRPASAILQILSYFIIIGFVWWFVDAFLIPGMVDKHRAELRTKFLSRYGKLEDRVDPSLDTSRWSKRDREAREAKLREQQADRQEPHF